MKPACLGVYMKLIVFLVVLFLSLPASANKQQIEVVGGGLTMHLNDRANSSLYSYKVSQDGKLISNPVYGLGYTVYYTKSESYDSFRVISGKNSIGSPIIGGTISHGYNSRNFQFGFIVGGYIQNNRDFENTGVVPDSLGTSSSVNAFVPIGGAEVVFKIPIADSYELKLNNIITPLLTNHSLSFGISF